MATKRVDVKQVQELMYDERLDALVESCEPVLAAVLGNEPSGIRELMAAADEGMKKMLLAYEARMNERTAQALRIGLVMVARRQVAITP
jgi:hypothetical protein